MRTDISGFYDSIDHEVLRTVLVELTGRVAIIDALIELLNRTMGTTRGIPQGLDASDALATAYVSSVDSAMLQNGFSYWRHGDDVRITVQSHDEGRRAVFRFEQALRRLRLLLNPDKTYVLLRSTYMNQMSLLDQEREVVREHLADLKREGLLEAETDELERLLDEAGIDEDTAFQIFYHGTMTIDEIADELRGHLEPSQVELAAAMFDDAVERAPNTEHQQKLTRELFHGALTSSLTPLIADRNTHAIDSISHLILSFPDETEVLCTYLRAVATQEPNRVIEQVIHAMQGEFLLGWQQAWLLSVLQEVAGGTNQELPEDVTNHVSLVAIDESCDWIARAAAIRLLGAVGKVDHSTFLRLWGNIPHPLRSELADAVYLQHSKSHDNGWAAAFVDTVGSDPVLHVVVEHAKRRAEQAKNKARTIDDDKPA